MWYDCEMQLKAQKTLFKHRLFGHTLYLTTDKCTVELVDCVKSQISAMPTCILAGALSKMVKEMEVAAMAWVEGSPYSASTRVSSLTTGGEGGRGSFSTSFITWPTYITNWKRGESTWVSEAGSQQISNIEVYITFYTVCCNLQYCRMTKGV